MPVIRPRRSFFCYPPRPSLLPHQNNRPVGLDLVWSVPSTPKSKYLTSVFQNLCYLSSIPSHCEGRIAIVTNAGRAVVDANGATDERAVSRTSKPCGSGAPLQASSSRRRQRVARMTGSTKQLVPGESAEEAVKPLRGECRMFSGASAVKTGVHTQLTHCAHQAAGALGTRHSPRPLFDEG